ncbi:MAG: HDOD domain-containing protein [Deltaproteobacteria bacterium]|nr:HDOD domain-containing protein [Deltaproteobacteria bacterium]
MTQLLEMIADNRSSAVDLGELILQDPSLTARILKVANSPFYQFSNKIETVSHAISLLGQETIRMICVSESFLAIFPMHKGMHLLFQQHNDHSLLTGVIAKSLVAHLQLDLDPEKSFIAGLLHDIGKPIIWYNFPEKTQVFEQTLRTGIGVLEAERLVYGFNHLEVGGWLAAEWYLSDDLAAALRAHHQEELLSQLGGGQPLGYREIIYLANLLAKGMIFAEDGLSLEPCLEEMLTRLLPRLQFSNLLASVNLLLKPFIGNLFIGGSLQPPTAGEERAGEGEKSADGKVVSLDESYQGMVRKALTMFNTYNYFLGNFQLGEAFYRMLENIQLSLGMSGIFILLYNRRQQELVVKGAPSRLRAIRDRKISVDQQDLAVIAGPQRREFWFSDAASAEQPELVRKLRQLFDCQEAGDSGVFIPVWGSASFVGGFVALCEPDQPDAPMIVEFLKGYAVQLALAIRIYRLNKRMMAAERDKTIMEMASSLAHNLNQPLQTLASYIYLLEKDMRVSSYSSASRNAYCEKMKRALDEINQCLSRFQSARECEATTYYGREKILNV